MNLRFLLKLILTSLFFSTSVEAASSCFDSVSLGTSFVERGYALSPLIPKEAPLKLSQINYKLLGDPSKPVVVLIHGLGGSLESWSVVGPELAKKYRVLMYDQRGHGKTQEGNLDYSTEMMAEDLNSLLTSLGLSKVSIVAHSLGARTAMQFIGMHPEKVTQAVFEDMDFVSRQENSEAEVTLMIEESKILKKYAGKSISDIRPLILELLPLYNYDKAKVFEFLQGVIHEVDPVTKTISFDRPHVVDYFGTQGNMDNFAGVLRSSTIPMLFIHGSRKLSPFFSQAGEDQIRQYADKFQIEEITKAGHSVHSEQPWPYLRLVKNFLLHGRLEPFLEGKFKVVPSSVSSKSAKKGK